MAGQRAIELLRPGMTGRGVHISAAALRCRCTDHGVVMHTLISTRKHTTYTSTHACTNERIHKHIHTGHSLKRTHTLMYTHSRTRICTQAQTRTSTLATHLSAARTWTHTVSSTLATYKSARTCTHTQIRTNTRTHICTHA